MCILNLNAYIYYFVNVDVENTLAVTLIVIFFSPVLAALTTNDLDKFLMSIGKEPAYVDLEVNRKV
jgi:hypothetical protein